MKERLLSLFEAACLLALGLLVVGYAARDKLKYFVNLAYWDLILAGGVALLVLGVLHTIQALSTEQHAHHDDGHDHDHDHGLRKRMGQAAWLLVPVALAVAFVPRPLSSSTAAARGVSNDLPSALQDRRAFQRVENRSLYDWVMALNLDPEPDHYKGDKVNVEGFALRDGTLPPDTFVVAKFVIACCAADARPVGIPVRMADAAHAPKDGAWVRVQGHIVESHMGNERHALVQAEQIIPIPEPPDPYLY